MAVSLFIIEQILMGSTTQDHVQNTVNSCKWKHITDRYIDQSAQCAKKSCKPVNDFFILLKEQLFKILSNTYFCTYLKGRNMRQIDRDRDNHWQKDTVAVGGTATTEAESSQSHLLAAQSRAALWFAETWLLESSASQCEVSRKMKWELSRIGI